MSERNADLERRREALTQEVSGKHSLPNFFNNFHLRLPCNHDLIDGKKISSRQFSMCQDIGTLDKRPIPDGPTPTNMGWRRAKKTEREFFIDITETAEKLGILDLIINCQIDSLSTNQQLRELEDQKKGSSRSYATQHVDLLNILIELLRFQRDVVDKRFYTLAIPLYVELRLRGYSHHDLVV